MKEAYNSIAELRKVANQAIFLNKSILCFEKQFVTLAEAAEANYERWIFTPSPTKDTWFLNPAYLSSENFGLVVEPAKRKATESEVRLLEALTYHIAQLTKQRDAAYADMRMRLAEVTIIVTDMLGSDKGIDDELLYDFANIRSYCSNILKSEQGDD